MASIFMNSELYLVATGYLVLEEDNLLDLSRKIHFDIFGLIIDGRQSFVIIFGLVILPWVWLNNLSILSYISTR